MKPVSSNNWTPQYKKTFAAGKEDFKPTLISECDVHDPFYFCFNCLKAPTKWKLDLKTNSKPDCIVGVVTKPVTKN
jgi:hypothetical protein